MSVRGDGNNPNQFIEIGFGARMTDDAINDIKILNETKDKLGLTDYFKNRMEKYSGLNENKPFGGMEKLKTMGLALLMAPTVTLRVLDRIHPAVPYIPLFVPLAAIAGAIYGAIHVAKQLKSIDPHNIEKSIKTLRLDDDISSSDLSYSDPISNDDTSNTGFSLHERRESEPRNSKFRNSLFVDSSDDEELGIPSDKEESGLDDSRDSVEISEIVIDTNTIEDEKANHLINEFRDAKASNDLDQIYLIAQEVSKAYNSPNVSANQKSQLREVLNEVHDIQSTSSFQPKPKTEGTLEDRFKAIVIKLPTQNSTKPTNGLNKEHDKNIEEYNQIKSELTTLIENGSITGTITRGEQPNLRDIRTYAKSVNDFKFAGFIAKYDGSTYSEQQLDSSINILNELLEAEMNKTTTDSSRKNSDLSNVYRSACAIRDEYEAFFTETQMDQLKGIINQTTLPYINHQLSTFKNNHEKLNYLNSLLSDEQADYQSILNSALEYSKSMSGLTTEQTVTLINIINDASQHVFKNNK